MLIMRGIYRPVPKTIRNHRDPSWDAFREAGLKPSLDGIEVFGRAVTPPHRHKRFDAWFFIKHLETPELPEIADSAELLNVGWFTFEEIWTLEKRNMTPSFVSTLISKKVRLSNLAKQSYKKPLD